MKKRGLFNFTPFAELPRRRRRDLYVSLRWRIMQEGSKYGGKFTSDLVLDEPGRPKLYKQWFEVYFLGTDGVTIWNATIFTATYEFWNKTRSVASERAFSLLSEKQQKQEGRLEWEGPFRSKDGEKYYMMAERPKQAYDCFGGLTLREYQSKREMEIIENEPPAIYESFECDGNYEYGIGLRAVVQADEINREVIDTTIDRFREVGEADWQSGQPVQREVLPFETQEMALSKVKYTI
ncbi:hypothetical protein [Nitrosovibrio sp. Nv6]|uniref:hypothetical protein n=1 Tax=Nitrosovibrio sp. Nv6 TaxID=1855340 RepID=UPI0008D3AE89|nr:hypothetical protein [Nitrosovibrio sp. Nv6]SEP38431.1 hypothetical protein SAMN05216316_2708 [Nitrosovibrio sp. Nv6]